MACDFVAADGRCEPGVARRRRDTPVRVSPFRCLARGLRVPLGCCYEHVARFPGRSPSERHRPGRHAAKMWPEPARLLREHHTTTEPDCLGGPGLALRDRAVQPGRLANKSRAGIASRRGPSPRIHNDDIPNELPPGEVQGAFVPLLPRKRMWLSEVVEDIDGSGHWWHDGERPTQAPWLAEPRPPASSSSLRDMPSRLTISHARIIDSVGSNSGEDAIHRHRRPSNAAARRKVSSSALS
jgi:hypothetical protein